MNNTIPYQKIDGNQSWTAPVTRERYNNDLTASEGDARIRSEQLVKRFGATTALNINYSQIMAGSIYGLVGPNGAGKSTYLRTMAGIYRPDSGLCEMDDQTIWENPAIKSRILFLPDQPSFLPHSTLLQMKRFYQGVYPHFSHQIYRELLETFGLDESAKLKTFSKGMMRQGALCLVIAAQPDLLLLDEAFDGLDPVMRRALRRILSQLVLEHNMTVVISSHNLRELEDLCDHVGVLHNGNMIIEQDLDDLKLGICRIQVAWEQALGIQDLQNMGLNIVDYKRQGSVLQLIISGDRQEITQRLRTTSPLLLEALPLTLEEIFIQTMEVNGYDIRHILG
ncbi:MAG TPA: ABC transporter ATP-binding protein [Clostridiaceae bacterium]|nr:ABC transporter ATP-binding protein [Clostridiaceae bacterium]